MKDFSTTLLSAAITAGLFFIYGSLPSGLPRDIFIGLILLFIIGAIVHSTLWIRVSREDADKLMDALQNFKRNRMSERSHDSNPTRR